MIEKTAVVIVRLAISAARVAMNTTGQNTWAATWNKTIINKGQLVNQNFYFLFLIKKKLAFTIILKYNSSCVEQYIKIDISDLK